MIARALAPVPIYLRYVAASLLALGADMGVFLAALDSGIPATAASAIGYSAGIVAHWLVSSRLVFDASPTDGAERHRQKALFVMTAFVGLGLTVAIIAAATRAGLDPRLAKLIAIGMSFQAGWLLRRRVVFA